MFALDDALNDILREECENIDKTARAELKRETERIASVKLAQDAAALRAAAITSKVQANATILANLEAAIKLARTNSQYQDGHQYSYRGGKHNWIGVKTRKHEYSCGCGYRGLDPPRGPCPSNVKFSQPSWEEYKASFDGVAWKQMLTSKNYDWSVG
jgi:hypothetical protein